MDIRLIMKTTLISKLLLLSLLVGAIAAQQPDLTVASVKDAPFINLILLGDTISTAPKCNGCDNVGPKYKKNDGAYVDMPSNGGNGVHSIPSNNGPLATWSVSDNVLGTNTFYLELEDIVVRPHNGVCVLNDDTQKCENGLSCRDEITLVFKAYGSAIGPLMTTLEITINIPGQGATTMDIIPIGTDPVTWRTVFIGEIVKNINPGCGSTKETKFDPSLMDPQSGTYAHQFSVSTDTYTVETSCETCPKEPIS
jgi:hypothetical protein